MQNVVILCKRCGHPFRGGVQTAHQYGVLRLSEAFWPQTKIPTEIARSINNIIYIPIQYITSSKGYVGNFLLSLVFSSSFPSIRPTFFRFPIITLYFLGMHPFRSYYTNKGVVYLRLKKKKCLYRLNVIFTFCHTIL